MVIPREGDKIRIYVQLSDTDAVDPGTGRINLGRYGPERLLEVAKKTVRPYTIDAAPDKIEWWTIYKGPAYVPDIHGATLTTSASSRTASCLEIHRARASFHCWGCLSYTLAKGRTGYECQHE
jgi:hypothetical protein